MGKCLRGESGGDCDEDEIDLGNLTGGFIGAIKNGFGLNWKPLQECGTCESSGGYCGYNSTREDAKFLCLCEDGSISGERCKGMLSIAPTSVFSLTCLHERLLMAHMNC
jgi:hypothetical protein